MRVVVAAGEEIGYLDGLRVSTNDDSFGHGPTGIALREGHRALAPDIANDPTMRPWRDRAAEHGLRSSAAFPLHRNGEVVAVLSLYSRRPRFFDAEEIGLLDQLVLDVSFALDALALDELRQSAERDLFLQARLFDEVTAAIHTVDNSGIVTAWNTGAELLYGWRADEAIGVPAVELIGVTEVAAGAEALEKLRAVGHWEGTLEVTRRDGTHVPAFIQSRLLRGPDGNAIGRVAVSVDISDRLAIEHDLRDAREFLEAVTDNMGEGLITCNAGKQIVYANAAAEDLLGWDQPLMGADLCRQVFGCQGPGDCTLCQMDPADGPRRFDDATLVCYDGHRLPVALMISPMHHNGQSAWVVVFSDDTRRRSERERLERELESLGWAGQIRSALEDGSFVLHAQPIVDAATGAVRRHELLVRMLADDGSLIPPGLFLPAAERHGLIKELDRWVISHGIEIAAAGHPVQINLSTTTLGDPSTAGWIETMINASGVDPACLVFEVTETALLADSAAAQRLASRLAELGCGLSLDDFGTGYGGFMYLKQLDVDQLKIDMEFVRDLLENPASEHVVRAVTALADGFNLETVAEGVEDQATLDALAGMGVDLIQGYHVGRPVPVAEAFA